MSPEIARETWAISLPMRETVTESRLVTMGPDDGGILDTRRYIAKAIEESKLLTDEQDVI